jgi:hypothetical protein
MTRLSAILAAVCLGLSACADSADAPEAMQGTENMSGVDRPSPPIGQTDSYVVEGDWAANQTVGLRWQRMPTARLNGPEAERHCKALGARLPTRAELYRLGHWGHANRAIANEMFFGNATNLERDQMSEIGPGGTFFWSSFWSSSTWHALRWATDFSGTISDSIGIPVVGCLIEPRNEVLVRCVKNTTR